MGDKLESMMRRLDLLSRALRTPARQIRAQLCGHNEISTSRQANATVLWRVSELMACVLRYHFNMRTCCSASLDATTSRRRKDTPWGTITRTVPVLTNEVSATGLGDSCVIWGYCGQSLGTDLRTFGRHMSALTSSYFLRPRQDDGPCTGSSIQSQDRNRGIPKLRKGGHEESPR